MKKMSFDTTRFGRIDYTEGDLILFADGPIGFSARRQFVLIDHKPGSPFRWLQSVEDGNLAFLMVDPSEYAADYTPMMPKRAASDLEMLEGTPRLVYTIVTIPSGRPEGMTLNLAAPIVINAANRKAKQVILEDDAHPVRWQVFQEGNGLPAVAA
jgi:flagellar assembly factor FliW